MSDRNYEQMTTAFPREEAWVVHAALLSQVESALDDGEPAPAELELVQCLETNGWIDDSDLELVRDALVQYLPNGPTRDEGPGQTALRAVTDQLEQNTQSLPP